MKLQTRGPTRDRAWLAWLAVLILLVHASLAVAALRQQAVTIDEYGHLPAGISYWQKGTFFVYNVNPPLAKLIAAIPVLAAGPKTVYPDNFGHIVGFRREWSLGRDFLNANRDRYLELFQLGRYPTVATSIVAGWFLFIWSRRLYGGTAGVLAVALWAFEPSILAHAQLITPDMGGTGMMFIASYAFWRWLEKPGWCRAVGIGVVLGVAELTKFTLLALYPVWIALWAVWFIRKGLKGTARTTLGQLSFAFLISIAVINAGYGFEGSFKPLGSFEFVSRGFQSEGIRCTRVVSEANAPATNHYELVVQNRFRGSWLGNLPVPLPEHFVVGIDVQGRDLERHPLDSYLRGELSRSGWWYYYFYGLLVKLPLGIWVLFMVAVGLCVSKASFRSSLLNEITFALPPIVTFALVSSQTGFSHHLRYVLPVYPFAFLFISRLGKTFDGSGDSESHASHQTAFNQRFFLRSMIVVCIIWNAWAVVRIHPHHLSYFNELAGGPENGPRHLINSNIDWGQDLEFLRNWVEQNPHARPLGFAYFNFVTPDVAGISYRLPPFGPNELYEDHLSADQHVGPQPGWYAVSVNFIYGMTFVIADGKGREEFVPRGAYTYFQKFEPVAKAGHSIYIYQISVDEANAVRHNMGLRPID